MRLLLILFLPAVGWAIEPAERRAIDFLSREVPRWARENRCYSCHNNGDAARSLLRAVRLGIQVDPAALNDTLMWLAAPGKWDSNRGDPVVSDKKLARLQFAAALEEAVDARLAPPAALREAARIVAREQAGDGAWRTEGSEAGLGSPVTWGLALTTALARRVVERGGLSDSVRKADRWFRTFEPRSHMDLAAAILGQDEDPRRAVHIDALRGGQNPDGGWGPYRKTPSEVFDTALALLALAGANAGPAVARGREYLIRTQLPSGGWPETTRPSGGQSYAQHISTTGWATLALVETAPR